MKNAFLLLLLFTFQTSLFSQSENKIPLIAIALGYEISRYHVIKKYTNKYQELFKYSKNIHCAACPQESEKGKGTWKNKNKLLIFKSKKKKDLNDGFTVDLNNTKAKIEENKIIITESEIPYLKNIVLVKQ